MLLFCNHAILHLTLPLSSNISIEPRKGSALTACALTPSKLALIEVASQLQYDRHQGLSFAVIIKRRNLDL